jgi:DnaJ-class molecular chaperone
MRMLVDAGDSFEGSIEYLMPGPLATVCPRCDGEGVAEPGAGMSDPCPRCDGRGCVGPLATADFAVMASYRFGNLQGQGGLRLISQERPEPCSAAGDAAAAWCRRPL